MRYYEIISEADVEVRAVKPNVPVKPKKPTGTRPTLSPEKVRREAERRATVQRQMGDEVRRHAAKSADLRAKLARTP